ncbi:TIGR02678 family protein [Nonomuraea longicatena]|uniref:TIGR02678 family protein n=1 Tax=Nonomuraea longicatena TaxID=83682 RepID=A0ABN1P486_9ACTN
MTPEEDAARARSALRALLMNPLLTDPDKLPLVRQYAAELRDWLTRETGWRLAVDSEAARLFKTVPDTADATRPARGRAGEPYSRRRYVVLCLALAVLERADAQTTLGRLAEEVLDSAAGFAFTLDTRAERADLVAVVRTLLEWGVLRRVAGDEEAYLSATGDVLYDVRRKVLAGLLTGARGPSTITDEGFEERLARLTAEPHADTDDLRNQALRRRLTRCLLDDPVLYYADLNEEELAYLTSQRHAIVRRIEQATGLVAEVRAEGIAMVDPEDELTDVRMPEQRTDGHVTLLVAERLAELGEDSRERLRDFVREQAAAHRSYWRKGVTEAGAEDGLLAVALDKLAALRLITVDGDLVTGRPAIARFALDAPTVKGPK